MMETCEKATGRKASIESIDRCPLLLHRKKWMTSWLKSGIFVGRDDCKRMEKAR
ncbi:hypothetical protein [Parageobacillus toebii]|nr:hypothetical protein [Parageobacillus toebii]